MLLELVEYQNGRKVTIALLDIDTKFSVDAVFVVTIKAIRIFLREISVHIEC
jgi:hypothetical protein